MDQEVIKWADEAQYYAEPDLTAETGHVQPQVTLVYQTTDPLRVMAAACELYAGHVARSPFDIDQPTAMRWLHDMSRTKLSAGLEFVDLHFVFEGVTRSFTHQLVRQRVGAVYVQESLRFAVKDQAEREVALPPCLDRDDRDEEWMAQWEDAVRYVCGAYDRLVHAGMPAEDARGLLPMNITTKVHYKTTLRGLAEHAGMRLCTQAAYEWKLVWGGIVREILQYGPTIDRWQQRAIVTLFKPVCFATGKCEFMASTDRYCAIRERVERHHAAGDPPDTWSDINPLEPLREGAARLAPEMSHAND